MLTISEQGYLIEPGEGEFEHWIGGPDVPGAECACKMPYLRMLTLDLRDPKLSFIPRFHSDALSLFYCRRCRGTIEYRLLADGTVESCKHLWAPEPEPLTIFPARRARLTPVGQEAPDRPRHQVGGRPHLIRDADSVCAGCRQAMPLLATANGAGFFRDCVQVIFSYCAPCNMVSARNSPAHA